MRTVLEIATMNSLDEIAALAQACTHKSPVIVAGSGASVPFGVPTMEQLGEYLLREVSPATQAETDSWLELKQAITQGNHLEQALSNQTLPTSLIKQVVRHTWLFMCEADGAVFQRVLDGEFRPPFAKLINHFFNTSNTTIDVVTTNYDRLIEYTCDVSGTHYASAFQPSYVSSFDSQDRRVLTKRGKPVQTVNIWKVHGSLDWFFRSDGMTLRAPLFGKVPNNLEPLIVTPGVSKFERLTDEPFRSTLQGADNALSNANGYLCIGFGFRDRQIEPKMVERLAKKNIPIVVITKKLTEDAATFLRDKVKSNFLVLEEEQGKTVARTPDKWDGLVVDGDYWSIEGFLNLVIPRTA